MRCSAAGPGGPGSHLGAAPGRPGPGWGDWRVAWAS